MCINISLISFLRRCLGVLLWFSVAALGAWRVLSMWTSIYLVRTENLHIPDANGALARPAPKTPCCVVLGLNGNRRTEAVSQCLCLKQLHHYHKMVLYLEILEKAWAASCLSYPLNFVWSFVCGLVSIGAWPNFEYSSEYIYRWLALEAYYSYAPSPASRHLTKYSNWPNNALIFCSYASHNNNNALLLWVPTQIHTQELRHTHTCLHFITAGNIFSLILVKDA